MSRLSTLLCAALIGSPVIGAHAATTATNQFTVTIAIVAQCTVTNPTTMAFASTGLLTSAVNQTSTFDVDCTNTTPYTVGLDNGANVSAGQRRMLGGVSNSEYVSYNLYSDSGRSVAWGNTTGAWVSGTGVGATHTYTVYGQVPIQTTPSPSSNYTDTVTITVTY